jgi:hypothetical protein
MRYIKSVAVPHRRFREQESRPTVEEWLEPLYDTRRVGLVVRCVYSGYSASA